MAHSQPTSLTVSMALPPQVVSATRFTVREHPDGVELIVGYPLIGVSDTAPWAAAFLVPFASLYTIVVAGRAEFEPPARRHAVGDKPDDLVALLADVPSTFSVSYVNYLAFRLGDAAGELHVGHLNPEPDSFDPDTGVAAITASPVARVLMPPRVMGHFYLSLLAIADTMLANAHNHPVLKAAMQIQEEEP